MSAEDDTEVAPVEALVVLVPLVPVPLEPLEPLEPVMPVDASGQWCPDIVVALLADELPLLDPLLDDELVDPDVVVDVLAVVDAWVPTVGVVELAPAASMPRPRLAPAAPATAAAATTACLSFITCPFTVIFFSGPCAHVDSENPRDKCPPGRD